jgi:hypothetical protein
VAISNKGDISEGILGCAIIAKFAKRQGTQIGRVSATDVQAVLQKLKTARISRQGVKSIVELTYDIGNSARDRITVSLKMTESAVDDLFKHQKQNISGMHNLINSAVSYVNSKAVQQQAEQFFTNRVNDDINIEVDGISGNSATKADIIISDNQVVVNKISLKSGGSRIGQVGGTTFQTYVRLFEGGPHPRTGKYEPGLGLKVSDPKLEQEFNRLRGAERSKETLQKATKHIYKHAANLLSQERPETLAENIVHFLNYHSTRQDDQIQLVVLDNIVSGRHKVLSPKQLISEIGKLKSIDAVYKDGMWPIILVYSGGGRPTTVGSPNVLFSIRADYESRSTDIKNAILKGKLMEKLATINEDSEAA